LAAPVTTTFHHHTLSNRMECEIAFTNSIASYTATP
jgi:hypothetical protein